MVICSKCTGDCSSSFYTWGGGYLCHSCFMRRNDLSHPPGMPRTQLTIREQFAMAAMTGILSNEAMRPAEGTGYKGYALAAKTMADALIEELAKPHAAHP